MAGMAVKTAHIRGEKIYKNCTGSLRITSQAVASSTNVHRICPLVAHVLLMLTDGASFMCTKCLAVSAQMEARPGVLPSHTLLPTWLAHGVAPLLAAK